jgi:2-keto-4-pentenoate hydratase/2-oxohepta-3-ene-1,7-dioic acid hydratase in catechol pathway
MRPLLALALLLAGPAQALTFAEGERGEVLLVLDSDAESARVLDLTARLGPGDAFDLLARAGRPALEALAAQPGGTPRPLAALRPAGGTAARHVATGANFRAHGAEVAIERVFQFPKFGAATGPFATLAIPAGALLDYEVELCVRFDRPIARLADFDAATLGLFLCGDFTDRARLTREVDRRDPASGQGFSDAKSGPGFFPTGPFLAIPADWRAFVAAERIETSVNGARLQSATGAEMVEDFRALAARMLAAGPEPRFRHAGQPVALLETGALPRGAALMSGTPEGIIFRPPGTGELAQGFAAYVFRGAWLGGAAPVPWVIEHRIAAWGRERRFLQPGDVVEHRSTRLGRLAVTLR